MIVKIETKCEVIALNKETKEVILKLLNPLNKEHTSYKARFKLQTQEEFETIWKLMVSCDITLVLCAKATLLSDKIELQDFRLYKIGNSVNSYCWRDLDFDKMIKVEIVKGE